jgi:S-adenosylmethionine hydrolase
VNVALLSDFGWSDGYVGALKGAVLGACPEARLIDLGHAIAPGDVRAAARVLAQAAPAFPPDTVFLSVVDPGVGSTRRGLAARLDDHLHVAPDNGLLSGVLGKARRVRAVALERSEFWRAEPSPVFHGRDVFGPVAGFLARGGRLEELGPDLDPGGLVRLPQPTPTASAQGIWRGEVIAVDHFGNLLTNLPAAAGARGQVEIAGRRLELRRTYSDVAPGELVALVGSSGAIEVACNLGRACDVLRAAPGLLIAWRPPSGGSS